MLTAHRLFDTLPNAEVIFEQSLNIYIAVKHCREHRWKWVFYVKAVAAVIVGLGDIAVIVLLLTAGQADRRQSNGRDASHWCGVWLQLALSSLTIIMMVRTMVLMITFFIRGTFAR